MESNEPAIGIIGGSGLYQIDGLKKATEHRETEEPGKPKNEEGRPCERP